jgi:8-oxo-dGTP pyrophosphatase MutT (NUDIX family)
MISFDIDDVRFNYRTAAICHCNDKILLHRARQDDFWALPGGRCEASETAKEAVVREMKEELDVSALAGRLVFVVENFFTYDDWHGHEVGMYFEVQLPQDSPVTRKQAPWTPPDEPDAVFRWFAAEELAGICIKPDFLTAKLFDLPPTTEHLVVRDR